MKTSKLLVTSLLAAAAMSTVPAHAEDLDLRLSGSSQNISVSQGYDSASKTATYDNVYLTNGTLNIDQGVITSSSFRGTSENGNGATTLNVSSGATLTITGTGESINSGDASFMLANWPRPGAVNVAGVLNLACGLSSRDGSGTFTVQNGGVVNFTTGLVTASRDAARMVIDIQEGARVNIGSRGIAVSAGAATYNISGGTIGILGETDAEAAWSTDQALSISGNVTFDTTKYVMASDGNSSSAATEGDAARGGTITLGNIDASSAGSSLNVSGAGTLALGGQVSLSTSIVNEATVSVGSTTVFVLSDTLKTSETGNTYSLISGGTISGWDSLTSSNFTYNGAAITVGRQLTSSEAGVVIYNASATAKTLTWDGRASGTWKDAGISENPEKPWTSSDGEEAFYRGDSVAFCISADTAITVSGTVAPSNFTANVAEAKTLTFSGGTVNISGTFSKTGTGTLAIESGTLAVAAPDVTLVSEGKITLAAGTTLDYGSSSLANNVTRDLSAVEGAGTILYKTQTHSASGGDYGNNKVTLSDDFTGDFVVGETGVQWIMADGSNFGGATIVLKGSSLLIAANEDVVISNAVRLDGPAAIWADRSADRHFTLNGGVSGSGAFTKAGSGTVTLGGTSTFTGNLTVESGTLELVGTRTSTSGSVTINSGATLDIGNATGKLYSTTSYVSGPTITIAGTLKVYDYTYGGSLGNLKTNGNGTDVVKLNGGTLVFTHSHEANRGTVVASGGGTVSVDADVEITLIGNEHGNAFTTNGGTLRLGGAGNLTLSGTNGIVTGSAAVEKFGAGTVTFSGANTYTGATTVSAGRLVASNANALSATASLTVAGGAEISTAGNAVVLGATGATITINGTYIVTAGGSLASDGAITIGSTGKIDISGLESGEYTIFAGNGAVSGLASGNIVDAGRSGRDTIALASDYKSFTLTRGAVYNLTWTSETGTWDTNTTWQNNDALSSVPNPTFADGDTVTFTASETAATAISVVGAKEAKAVNVTGGNYTFSAGTDGSLSVRDALTISGASTTLTLNGGLLGTVGDGIVISDGGKLIMGTGASLGANKVDLSGGTLEAGAANLSLANAVNVAADSEVNTQTHAMALSGVITGTGTLTKQGTGTLVLTNNGNAFAGAIVSAGTLVVGAANGAIGEIKAGADARIFASPETAGSIVVESGAAFKTHLGGGTATSGADIATALKTFNGNFYLKSGSTLGNIDGHVKLAGGIVFGATDTVGVYSENSTVVLTQHWQKTVELAGVLSGVGTVKLTSPTSEENDAFYKISGDKNTFSGTYKLENATNKTSTLVLSSQNAAKDAKVNLSTSGARIFLGAANVTIAGLEGVSGSTIQLTTESRAPSASTLTVNQASDTTFAGTIEGGIALKKTGARTLTLSGNNTFTGGTVIEAGTLVAGSATALGTTKGVEVKSGATLNLGTSAVTVDGLSGAGTVGLAAGTTSSTLTVNSATDSTFSGDLFGAISLVKQGAGTLELSGSNTVFAIHAIGGFDPGVDVQAGTVRVVQTGSNYQSFTNVSVADGATLELSTVLDRTAVDATSVVLSSSAKILVDMSNYASDADVVAVNLISASALSYAGTAIDADNVGTLLGAIELKNWGDGWTQSLSYAGNILSLTLTIPEPSVFGLLAGLGALALAGTRRRRRKA